MKHEVGLTQNQIISELAKSTHGNLSDYVKVGLAAAKAEPEFYAHLIAWNQQKGQVRDSKAALPVINLAVDGDAAFQENALAHLAMLGPRELLQAFRFAKAVPGITSRKRKKLRALVIEYLRKREKNWKEWERVALQHRHTLKELYVLTHKKVEDPRMNAVLYTEDSKGTKMPLPSGSLFELVNSLKNMTSEEAAGTIINSKLPFIIVKGALGAKMKDTALVQAMIERMSATELVTNSGMLEKLGMKDNPVLRASYQKALEKAQASKQNVLKTTRAAEAVKDETVKAQLRDLQEKQLASMSVEGDWLVIGDRSGSMLQAIEVAREVAATLAKMVKGKVWLVFSNTMPQTIDVTGCSLDIIKKATQGITPNGGTSLGCGLMRMLDSKTNIDGIAIVSDGGDNTAPYFHDTYMKYSKWADKEVPVYFYQVAGDPPYLIDYMKQFKLDLQVFDLRGKVDFYSLPNIVSTMRTNRYSLVDEVMATKLLTLKDVFGVDIKLGKENRNVVATVS